MNEKQKIFITICLLGAVIGGGLYYLYSKNKSDSNKNPRWWWPFGAKDTASSTSSSPSSSSDSSSTTTTPQSTNSTNSSFSSPSSSSQSSSQSQQQQQQQQQPKPATGGMKQPCNPDGSCNSGSNPPLVCTGNNPTNPALSNVCVPQFLPPSSDGSYPPSIVGSLCMKLGGSLVNNNTYCLLPNYSMNGYNAPSPGFPTLQQAFAANPGRPLVANYSSGTHTWYASSQPQFGGTSIGHNPGWQVALPVAKY